MKPSFLQFSAAALIFLAGCASTSMTSFTDPSYRTTSFSRILVVANISDLQLRQNIETRLVREFQRVGTFALEGMSLFPPTRNLTEEEKIDLLVQNGIDSYIVVGVGETGTQEVYIPQTGSSTTTKGIVNVYGNSATYKQKSTTTTYGGYTVSKPWAQFDAKLFDVSTGQNAWTASAFTGGNAYANFNTVVNSFCEKTVEQLIKDGMVISAKSALSTSIQESKSGSKFVDVVYLKNGSIIKGKLLDVQLEKSIKLETSDGNVFVFQMSEVEKIEKQQK